MKQIKQPKAIRKLTQKELQNILEKQRLLQIENQKYNYYQEDIINRGIRFLLNRG